MSILSTLLSVVIILPTVPVFAYVIGLLVPASHIVSRSSSFKISSKRLWHILTDVSKYPEWQPKVEDVMIEEISKEDNNNKIVFIELSTRKRHSVIIHHERTPYQCLIRILEERPSITISGSDNKRIPTFSGSWTFEIIEEKEKGNGQDQVTLKITEQGVIKKPLVRVTHLLMFGFHSRIDRFMKDLHKLVDKQTKEENISVNEEEKFSGKVFVTDAPLGREKEGEQSSILPQEFHSAVLPHQNNSNTSDIVTTAEECIHEQQQLAANDQQVETNDTLMTESSLVSGEKEWDLMSEIYERPKTES